MFQQSSTRIKAGLEIGADKRFRKQKSALAGGGEFITANTPA